MAATIELENKLDIDEILEKIPETESFMTWAKMRFSKNNNYVALYSSGKILISGTKSDLELYSTANKLSNYLNDNGISNNIQKIKVNNYVLIDQMNIHVNLEKLLINLLQYDVSYEPEQFPALKFKDSNNITYLLFNSGKITITGVKSLDNLEEHVAEFKQLIYEKSNI